LKAARQAGTAAMVAVDRAIGKRAQNKKRTNNSIKSK